MNRKGHRDENKIEKQRIQASALNRTGTKARLDELELFTPCEFFSYTLALVRLSVCLSRICSPKERPSNLKKRPSKLPTKSTIQTKTLVVIGLQVLRFLVFIVLVMSELNHLRKKPPDGGLLLDTKTGDSKNSVKSVG